MSPSGWSQRWDPNPHARPRAGRSGLGRLRKPTPPRWEWSARGDSNPDLHGLDVPRLPVAPRADGDHGRTRTATGQALNLLPLPDWATWPLVPLGGLEPPPPGLRARHAALTLQRDWSEWRDSNPHLKAWKARRQPLPHIRVDSAWAHTQTERGPVSFTGPLTSVCCQRPRSCEHILVRRHSLSTAA